MSSINIKIRTDNAAFDDEHMGPEVARILRELADRVEQEGVVDTQYLRDVNGNRVGYANRIRG